MQLGIQFNQLQLQASSVLQLHKNTNYKHQLQLHSNENS